MKPGSWTKRRLFGPDVDFNQSVLYAFDAVGLLLFFGTWLGWQGLKEFTTGAPLVTVSLHDVALLGGCGFYGFRLASWIARFRHSQMPQRVEWAVTIVPSVVALLCLVLSGPIERGFAAAHGYRYCAEAPRRRGTDYIFAAASASCPAKPIRVTMRVTG